MCINGKTYNLFQAMGVEVVEVALDLVMDVAMGAVVDVVVDKEGPMANVAVPNLLIWMN